LKPQRGQLTKNQETGTAAQRLTSTLHLNYRVVASATTRLFPIAFTAIPADAPSPMKKTFPLTHPKIKPPRLADSIRAEVKKYITRERRKKLPDGVDFWDFDCKVGADAVAATEQHISEVSKAIGQTLEEGSETVYVEILAKPATRSKKVED
jgi:hypothetical protein